ncbi:MAG: GntR family transcriptional regulator [Phycisphaeraceae bacterium]|nr:GntR family transcriptional regulator [Phycisphaeraceae bacterium]
MTFEVSSARAVNLSDMIQRDIQQRGLRTGDRYLTTEEVAQVLGVAKGTANKALQHLARRQVLVRNRKLGTFIGERAVTDAPQIALDVVHLLVHRSYFIAERSRIHQIITGLVEEMGDVATQITFVPEDQGQRFVQRLIRNMQGQAIRAAFVLAVKSAEIQVIFQNLELPAVVLGTPYPGRRTLTSLDLDQHQVGRLVIDYVLSQGRQRIAVLLRDQRGLGDDHMLDEITSAVMRSDLAPGALKVRSVPMNKELAEMAVRRLFAEGDAPTAVICRTRIALDCLLEMKHRGEIPGDVLVVSGEPVVDNAPARHVPHIRPCISLVEEGRRLAHLLLDAEQRPEEPTHVLLEPRLYLTSDE